MSNNTMSNIIDTSGINGLGDYLLSLSLLNT